MYTQNKIIELLKALALYAPKRSSLAKQAQEEIECLESHTVFFTWTIEDVQSVREDLTDEQAYEVLVECENNHDADVGMNWDTISVVADNMFPEHEDE